MELTHDFTVPADVETTWATFLDLESVGGCFPGATVTEASGESFSGTVKVKLGPIALMYAGSGQFLERDDAAHRAVIEAKGKDKRGNGTAGATVTMQLAPSGDGTRVDVTTEMQITGKPAQFGRGVMQDVSDKLLQQFIACIEGKFAEAGVAAAAAQESTTETALDEVPTPGEVFDDARAQEGVAPPAHATPSALPRSPTPDDDDAIDLGATVLPVLARTYAPYAGVALIALVIGWLLGRRRG